RPIGHSEDRNGRIQPAVGLRASTSASASCLRSGLIGRWVSCDDENGPTITRWRVAPLDNVTVAVSVFQPDCASVARKRSASSLLVNDPACSRNSCAPSTAGGAVAVSVGSGRDEIFSFGRRSKNSNRVTGVESLAAGACATTTGRLLPHHFGNTAARRGEALAQ